MIPLLAALALATQAAGPAAAPDDGATDLAGLQQVYDQSCAAREYGAYDDMCDQLRLQIKAERARAERAAREAARRPAAAVILPKAAPAAKTPAALPSPG